MTTFIYYKLFIYIKEYICKESSVKNNLFPYSDDWGTYVPFFILEFYTPSLRPYDEKRVNLLTFVFSFSLFFYKHLVLFLFKNV
jgi:hypothetical protein